MCQECAEDQFYFVGRYTDKALDKDLMANLLFEVTTNGEDVEDFMFDYWQNQHTYEWNLQEFKKIFDVEFE